PVRGTLHEAGHRRAPAANPGEMPGKDGVGPGVAGRGGERATGQPAGQRGGDPGPSQETRRRLAAPGTAFRPKGAELPDPSPRPVWGRPTGNGPEAGGGKR